MNWFIDNWPLILVVLAMFIILAGLMRRVAKMAFFGLAVGAVGLVIWPYVTESF
ncbi:MAG: hypothetical protein WBM50_20460 [Acidimicrobiales bacterium]